MDKGKQLTNKKSIEKAQYLLKELDELNLVKGELTGICTGVFGRCYKVGFEMKVYVVYIRTGSGMRSLKLAK
jgi:hypothetical protein